MNAAGDRYPPLDETRLTPRQREVYDRIVAGPRGQVVGPLRVWIQSPELAEGAQALGAFCRYDSSLPPDLSELAILVTARLWSAGFEWAHHAPIAAAAGIGTDVIDAISRGERPTLEGRHAAVFDAAVEIQRDRRISDDTFARALDSMGLVSLIDLVGICGYYGLISMTINVFQVPISEGPALPEVALAPEDMFRTQDRSL